MRRWCRSARSLTCCRNCFRSVGHGTRARCETEPCGSVRPLYGFCQQSRQTGLTCPDGLRIPSGSRWRIAKVRCTKCDAAEVTERPERTARGYRRFRCRACGKQFNERSGGMLNRTQYPSDVIALVVFWRLRYKLSLRDLTEMFLIRGIEFSYEAVRDWEAKLTPSLIDSLRRQRKGRIGH